MPNLIDIPQFNVGTEGPLGIVRQAPERLASLMRLGQKQYGTTLLRIGDRLGRTWLKRNVTPYAETMEEVASHTPAPGAISLNLSYDFGCTTATGPDPIGPGNRMLRTLDWPLDGLGRELAVAHHQGSAGPYYDVTWPGFVGVVTAMAPERFSVAINQPPARRHSPLFLVDAVINRRLAWRQTAIPPVHLLRRVCETCSTFEEARHMLTTTPISIPAFFTISGLEPNEGCVIERTETDARVHSAPFSISNHWLDVDMPGWDRGNDSLGRLLQMNDLRDGATNDFNWVKPPILNETTRLAVVANAAQGALHVRGYEANASGSAEPVTTDFRIQ